MTAGRDVLRLVREHGPRVPMDEIHEANVMTPEEFRRALDFDREQARAMAAREAESAEARRVRVLGEETTRCGIPERYHSVPLDLRFLDQIEQGRGLYVWGERGTGKTWLACSVARGWISRHGGGARFVSAPSMVADLRSSLTDGRGEAAVTSGYVSVPLLVVDDVGKEVATAMAVSKLFEVTDGRYGARRPTVWTSQLRLDRLAEHVAGRGDELTAAAIASRIADSCRVVEMRGRDRRLYGKGDDGRWATAGPGGSTTAC